MITYTHRNGETTPPTEQGRYWFKGMADGAAVQDLLPVVTDPRQGILAWRPMLDDGWHEKIDRFDGQWWGPVSAPWDKR